MVEHFDVIVVGAGLAGIGAAVHLKRGCPDKSFVLLEAREATGGTWDLFRYPGIRSDSDMFTLGYAFRPWKERKAIADGPSILKYLRDTARDHGIEPTIRFQHRVTRAHWSSDSARWTLEIERGTGETTRMTTSFLWCCTGYYDYDAGYTPVFPGRERFEGEVVHPQHWHEGIDYSDKRVIVIGSGATAVTLVPALAERARHVVMLQRSPSYVISRPAEDRIASALGRFLPDRLAYSAARGKNVLLSMLLYELSRRRPERIKRWLIAAVAKELGGDYDVARHFTPRYAPWDQRLCMVPDGDLFAAIRRGRASVVTGEIDTFTESGIRMKSGEEIAADMIVTATGLVLKLAGGVELTVDGRPVVLSELVNYKGIMFSDVPNVACTVGYTNASWTLKADLTAEYVVRLLRRMEEVGAVQCTPRLRDPSVKPEPIIGLRSGYVERALHWLPKQGSKRPWRLHQNYLLDLLLLRYGPIDDAALELSRPGGRAQSRAA